MCCRAFLSTDLICEIPASRLTWRLKSTLATVGPTPLQILGHMVRFRVQVFSAGDLPIITSGGQTCLSVQEAAWGMPCTTDPDSNLCPCNYWCDDKPYYQQFSFFEQSGWFERCKRSLQGRFTSAKGRILWGVRPVPVPGGEWYLWYYGRLAEDVGMPFSATISMMALRQDAQILQGSVRKWNAIRLQPASATSTNYLMITSMVNVSQSS